MHSTATPVELCHRCSFLETTHDPFTTTSTADKWARENPLRARVDDLDGGPSD